MYHNPHHYPHHHRPLSSGGSGLSTSSSSAATYGSADSSPSSSYARAALVYVNPLHVPSTSGPFCDTFHQLLRPISKLVAI